MTFLRCIFVLLTIFSIYSCDFEETATRQENLPRSTGKTGEIIVVMDSAFWENALGDTLRSIFSQNVPTINRQEPFFSLNHIEPKDFKSFFTRQRNVMFVTVLDDKNRGNRRLKRYFTSESLRMIDEDPSLYMFIKQNEFAKDQNILHLFGKTSNDLMSNLTRNRNNLLSHYLKIEEDRIYKSLYSVKYEQGVSNHIKQKLGCSLLVPSGFEIGLEDEKFVWLRDFSPDVDKSIFISWMDYTSEEMFSLDSLLKYRTELSKPYILYKPEDKESYLLTETKNFDVFRQEINFKGQYAVELKGLWKTNKYYMGGPFVGYAMVDEASGRLYYIEAFLYSPGQPQRDNMRELETILKTFKLAGNT